MGHPGIITSRSFRDCVQRSRNEVKKTASPGRPTDTKDSDHVIELGEILEKYRTFTCDIIARKVCINHGSVYTILTTKLNMRCVGDRSVPNGEQNETWVDVAKSLYIRYEYEYENVINLFTTIDET